MKKEKKKNKINGILKKIKNWFSLIGQGYLTEVQDRVFMSWKRVIKFLGISIVPIIYGVVCLVAFWNPITGIGRAPIAVFNQDQNIILVESFDANAANGLAMGALVAPEKEATNEDATLFEGGNSVENLTKVIANLPQDQELRLNNGLITKYDKSTTHLTIVSMWEVMKSMMLPKTNLKISDEDYVFKTPVIAEGMALTNIHYISDEKEINDQWHGSKYYVQVKLEKNYTANLFGWLGSVIANQQDSTGDTTSEWKDKIEQMKIWTTFERNFIFGYYMQTFSNFASGMIFQAIPNTFIKLILGSFTSGLSVSGKILNIANGETPIKNIDDNQSYVVLRTGDATNPSLDNEASIRPYSLFGNVNNKGYPVPPGDIEGKFISSIKEIKKMEELGIIKILKSIFPPSAVVERILDWMVEKMGSINDPNALNSYIYRAVTGQLQQEDVDSSTSEIETVLLFLKIIGFNTNNLDQPNPDNSNETNLDALNRKLKIFDGEQTIITEKEAQDAFDTFLVKNSDIFLGAKSLKELPSLIASKIIADRTGGISTKDLVGFKLQGAENGLYGIGLGQFFLVIGLWIGILMHTFVFDRAKRLSKLTPSTWYLSKTLLMLTVAMIQATLLVWVAYLAGWHAIGLAATAYLWLWLLAAGVMFVIIIQGLWFVVKDETIGKFMAVVLMVLSLAAGGGTFPALAQFKFFAVIGHVVPFTYVLRGMGAIVYGVSILGTTANTTNVILQAFGFFFIYIVLFGSLGLFVGAKNRFKEMNYGSHYGRCVALAMIALKRDPDKIGFREFKKTNKKGKKLYKYHWNKLAPGLDMELYLKSREMFPFEGRFKWWEKKHHDPVQKPNFSDEDIITRNE